MDSTDDNKNDDVERMCRTLWVGNLHPKVSYKNVAELFYQVGPIEYIEFAFDDREVRENYAWVVFKHSCSVDDSIKLFRGTKLYGLPIVTKNVTKHDEDPIFHDQLNYFKQLVNVERNTQSNYGNKNRWNDQSPNNKNSIPDSLPAPPMHINSNKDNYDQRSDNMPKHSFKDKSSKYQHPSYSTSRNPVYRSERNHINKSQYSGRYRKSEHSSFGSVEVFNNDRDSYHSQNYDHIQRDFNGHTSSNWEESTYHNQESFGGNNSTKNVLPVRDLRDTMYRKRSSLDSNYHNNTNSNAACTSLLDLRDTMYRNKNNRYEDPRQQNKSNLNDRWSERNQKNTYGFSGSFSDNQSRKNNYTSEQKYNESNIRHQNNYGNEDYYNQSYNEDNVQKYDNEYPNKYNDSYSREKYRSNSAKYNQMRSKNMESNNRQYNYFHPHKHNDNRHDKKEYKNAYNELSDHSRGKNYNRDRYT